MQQNAGKEPGKQLANFWYHYKWHTLVSVFVVLFLIICISQMTGKAETDAHILYTGPSYLDKEVCSDIVASVNTVAETMGLADTDVSGDGVLTVDFNKFVYVPDALAAEYKENDLYFNGAENADARGDFDNAIIIGEYVILLIDRSLYEDTVGTGAFAKWEDTLGFTPEKAIDEYGILLCDLPLGSMNGFRQLPEDTVLCCRAKSYVNVFNKKVQNAEMYAAEVKLFCQLVSYTK